MSGEALKKVRTGDPLRIPARAYNAFVDAAVDLRHRQQAQEREAHRLRRDTDVVLVRNSTESILDRFEVLGLGGPIFTPDNALEVERIAFNGVVPQESHEGRFAILLETAAPGAIVRAALGGVVPVMLEVQDPDHAFADVLPGSTDRLRSEESGGAQILWKAGSGTPRWAIVRLPAGGGGECDCDELCLSGGCLEFDENDCLRFKADVASTTNVTAVTGGSLSIVGDVLRLTLTRGTIGFQRNACGVVVGVTQSAASSIISDVPLTDCE
jgi:hypothetical protein